MTPEIWRPIEGWEGRYAVSSFGRIRAERTGVMLKPAYGIRYRNGERRYAYVTLQRPRLKIRPLVHRLVALAFIGPRPLGHQVNHKDGVKANNAAENLEYVTASQNVRHSFQVLGKQATRTCGERAGNARLTDQMVREARQRYEAGEACVTIARGFGISNEAVRRAIHRRTWAHVA